MNMNSTDTKNDWDPDSSEVTADQVAAYDKMRNRCPVAHSESRGWSVFRHADVIQILNDPKTFSSTVSRHLSVPNGMDPPEHTRYRAIIEPYFGPERMAAFEPTCRSIAAELLDEVASHESDIEVMSELATHFAVRIQCAFLGWPTSLHEPLIQWTASHQNAVRQVDRETLATLATELETIVADLIQERVQNNAKANDDLTASLMHENVGERKLNGEEISSILRNWTVGEVGTISASIGILIHHLAEHPKHQTTLRDDSSLLPQAIDEILRVHNPLHSNRRTTTCPVTLNNRPIEAGERVDINWIAANRDETVFEAAHTVKLERDSSANLLYGAGIHVCPGAPLARMEMLVFMEELFAKTVDFHSQPKTSAVPESYPASGYSSVPIRFQFQR
ncbi:cytochrome P450 [Neorhodopirellula lusitana]|nr:cytochrome P450 [Neorhodopirellula lusitana]